MGELCFLKFNLNVGWRLGLSFALLVCGEYDHCGIAASASSCSAWGMP